MHKYEREQFYFLEEFRWARKIKNKELDQVKVFLFWRVWNKEQAATAIFSHLLQEKDEYFDQIICKKQISCNVS